MTADRRSHLEPVLFTVSAAFSPSPIPSLRTATTSMPRTKSGNAHAWSASHSLEWDIETFGLDAQKDLESSYPSESYSFNVVVNPLHTTLTIDPDEVHHSPPVKGWLDDPDQPRYTRWTADVGLIADHRQGPIVTDQRPQSETIDQFDRAWEQLPDPSCSSQTISHRDSPGQIDLIGLVEPTSEGLRGPSMFPELSTSPSPSQVSVDRHHCPQDNCAKSFDHENKLK